MAGLGAAYSLRKRGLDAIVFEASSRPGGRVAVEEVGGFRMDVGANIFLETFDTVKELAAELGVPLERTRVPIHGGVYRNGKFHGLYGGDHPRDQWKTIRTLLSFRLLSPRGLWQLMKFGRMLKARCGELSLEDPSRMATLDDGESAADFVASKIGSEFLEWFFGPNLSGYTFAHPEQVGAAYGMAVLWYFGLNAGWPLRPKGGAGAFVDALARACGPSIRTSTPATRIVIEDGCVRGVVAEGGLVEADAVICATTATAALRLAPDLPSGIRDALGRVTYSSCCRVFFGLDSSPFPGDWYGVMFPRQTGAFMSGMSNSAALAPESVPEGKALIDALVIGTLAEELSALSHEQVVRRILAETRKYFPAMTQEPLFTRVHRWDEAACLAPGGMISALHRMRGTELKAVKGLFLAGEYMGVPSVNGAVRSGLDAAADCAAFVSPGPDESF